MNLGIWVNVESNVGLVCACLPTLRPLLHRAFNVLSDISGSRSSRGKNSSKKSSNPSRSGGIPASAGVRKVGTDSSNNLSGSGWSGETRVGASDGMERPGNRRLVSMNNSSRSQPGWYTNVMASVARVDRDIEMRSQQEWIRLREQQDMV